MIMSDFAYLLKQLQNALDDSPGGEKAWVPLRRSLVIACKVALLRADYIEETVVSLAKMIETGATLVKNGVPVPAGTTVPIEMVYDSPQPFDHTTPIGEPQPIDLDEEAERQAKIAHWQQQAQLRHDDYERWQAMSREERIATIRSAVAGEINLIYPDKRMWRRHYPEAFQAGETP